MAKHPNYEIFEELGRGENSVVYRAWDLLLKRDVAIKELNSEPGSDGGRTDAERTNQLLKEAGFLAQFEHENVLRIHTVEQDRGWIVMELMKGSLANQISVKPMDADTVRSVLRQVLTALDFLHSKGKVHGSVRPSNILINDQGTVKLSDFEASSRDGELRVPKGSKKYLAPELIRSEFGEFGPTVDLYCLGFTALELLTGKKFDTFFEGTGAGAIDADVAWLRWHSSDQPMRPIKELAPKVPSDLVQVLDQLLMKPVDERPKNAAAVLKLLNDVPLVPVEVAAQATDNTKSQDVSAILPSKAVTLREPPKRQSLKRKKATGAASKKAASLSGKDKLNETLGKPYVLWPICIGILVGALMLGLQLRGDRDGQEAPAPGNGQVAKKTDKSETKKDPSKVKEPVVATAERLAVTLNVFPGTEQASLTIDGVSHDFDNLELESGEYEINIQKDGYEKFASSLQVDKTSTTFDIFLNEVMPDVEPVAKGDGSTKPEPEKPAAPKYVDIRIEVFPRDAALLVDGKPVELNEGTLRINPAKRTKLELAANADGYQARTAEWSLDEIAAADYNLKLFLEKLPTVEPKPTMTLPTALIPKPKTDFDVVTGLPKRALVKKLQGAAPLEMVLVPAGTYQFGVPDGELRSWELPAEQFVVEKPFYIGLDEVTNTQYMTFSTQSPQLKTIATNPSDLPVTNMSVRQAAEFCSWAGGRLPTEREWEAAVRGPQESGFPLPWSNGSQQRNLDADRCKLFRGESDSTNGLAKTGELSQGASSLGLLNAIGNAAEWCDDQLTADSFIIKGCSYRIPPGDHVRVTWRNRAKWNGAEDIGMRLLIPVFQELDASEALAFVAPNNLETLLVSDGSNLQEEQNQLAVYTKTTKEIADEFTGPAELVIDSGGFMDQINAVCFSPDGNRIAVGGGKLVRIWDVNTGDLLETLRGDISRTSYGNVNAIAWSPDGQSLLVGVSDYREHGNIRVYSTDLFDEVSQVLTGHEAPCRKLTFSRDGKYLVSVDSDGLVLVRDWKSKDILKRIPARDRDQPIFDVMAFPTDEPFMLGVDFGGPQIFSAITGKRLGAQDEMPEQVRGWLVDIFNKLVKLPYDAKTEPRVLDFRMEEGRWAGAGDAIVDGRSRFWIRVWQSRAPVTSAVPAKELGSYDKHRWNVTALSLQPNGTLVASGDKFGEVHVWDSTTGERKFKFAGQGKPIYEVAFDKQSSRLAFGTRPHSPKDWGRNKHGAATKVLNLRERSIADLKTLAAEVQLQFETPAVGDSEVKVRRKDANYFVEHLMGNQVQSEYRISSGRNPTVFTLLDQPKLDVQQPVVFGDNEGLLALWDSASDELKRAYIGHGGLVSAISASSNGKLIATSSTDRTIRLWSLENYVSTGTFDFKFENSAVREVVPGTSSEKAGVQIGDRIVSIDGKSLTEMFELMLTGKFDYKPGQAVPVKMKREGEAYEYQMQMADGYDFAEPILNFYMGDDGQWIIWHPQGYYDASPGADRLIGWHLNRGYDKSAKYFEVQQFRKKLYRPDVIDGILEFGSLEAALAKLESKSSEDKKPLDFRDPEELAQHHPPGVKITYPTDRWQTESETVTVTGEATSVNGLPLTAITLLHNGSVAKVFRPTGVNQLTMKIEYEMRLGPGSNDLVLIAANAKASSQGEHIVVDLNRPASSNQPDAVVLAIGVSDFDGALSRLPNANADASRFSTAMKSHENGKLYGNVKVKLLSDKVSDNDVLEGFQWLADNVKEGDVAMVYVASHAIVDRRDNFYIATANSDESKARSTAVSWRDLMDTLQLDLPDCKRMVFLDLKPTESSIRPGLRNPLLDLAAPEMGTIFLSSNTLQQSPPQQTGSEAGAFLQAVMETVGDRRFDTSPSTGDALFNPVELASGVMTRVKDLTNDQQQPVFFAPEFAKLANVLELQK